MKRLPFGRHKQIEHVYKWQSTAYINLQIGSKAQIITHYSFLFLVTHTKKKTAADLSLVTTLLGCQDVWCVSKPSVSTFAY